MSRISIQQTGNTIMIIAQQYYIMVKSVFAVLAALTLITGCNCYRGPRNEFGFSRMNIDPFYNIKENYSIIDTTCVYKLKTDYYYNSTVDKYSYYDNTGYKNGNNTIYLKFYPDGKVGTFVIAKADTTSLTQESFNPKRAKMGYYTITDNIINIKLVTNGNCGVIIARQSGIVNGNAVELKYDDGNSNRFVKSKIPYSYLNWKPDW